MFSLYRNVLCIFVVITLVESSWWGSKAAAQVSKLTEGRKSQLDEATEYLSVAIKLNDMGLANDARMVAERGLARRKIVLGEESPETADALSDLGLICREQADYKSARTFLEQALAINKKERGLEDPATATVLERLGVLLELQADVPTSREYTEQALSIRKKVLGENHPKVANSLTYLGELMRLQGEFDEALPVSEKALALCKKIHGEEHRDTGKAYSALGDHYLVRGDIEKARPNYERALAIRKKVLSEQHPETALALLRWGIMLNAEGKNEEANSFVAKGLEINKKMRGEDHPDTAGILSVQGQFLLEKGDFKGAIQKLENVLAVYKKRLGDNHHDTASALQNLGLAYYQSGDIDAALPYSEQSLKILRETWGAEHPDTANAGSLLGNIYFSKGYFENARLEFVVALNSMKAIFGDESDHAATCYYYLGMTGRAEKYYKTARKNYEKSLAIYVKNHGDDYTTSIVTRSELGNTLYEMEEYEEARKQFEQVLSLRRKVSGSDSAETAEAANILGVTVYTQANYKDARKYYDEALAIRLKLFGEEDLRTATTLYNIGLLLQAQKLDFEARDYFNRSLVTRKKLLGEKHDETKLVLNALEKLLPLSELFSARPVAPPATPTVDPPVPPPVAPPAMAADLPKPEKSSNAPAIPFADLVTTQEIEKLTPNQLAKLQTTIPQLNKAIELYGKGQFREFVPMAENASNSLTEIFGPNHKISSLVATLRNLAKDAQAKSEPATPMAFPNPPKNDNPPTSPSNPGAVVLTPQDLANISPAQIARVQSVVPQLQKAIALYQKGQMKEFLPIAEKLTAELTEVLGPVHKITALAIGLRGAAHSAIGEYDAALPLLEQSLSLHIKHNGEQNKETTNILSMLAGVHAERAELKKAKEYADRSFTISKQLFGENSSATASAITQLGTIATSSGDFEQARAHFSKALAIHKNTYQADSADPVKALTNLTSATVGLANIQRLSGEFLQARQNYEAVLDIRRKVLGEQHPDTGTSYVQMALLYDSIGDVPLTKKYLEQALDIFKVALGENHPFVASTLGGLGEICIMQKDLQTARTYMEQCRSSRQKTYGENHPEYASAMVGFGDLEQASGNYKAARDYFDRAHSIIQKASGKDSIANTTSVHNIFKLLLLEGKYKEARPFAEELIRLLKSSVAKDSFDMAVARRGLSEVLAGLKDWSEAASEMDTARRLVRKAASEILPGLSERELLLCLRKSDEDFWHSALSLGVARKEDQAVVDLSASWLVNGKGIAQESLAQQQATRLAKKEGDTAKRAVTSGKWVDLETVRKALSSDTLLIDIARIRLRNFSSTSLDNQWGEPHYIAWVISALGKDDVRIVDLGDAESIDTLVSEFNLTMKASMTIGKKKGTIQELGDVDASKLIEKPLRDLAIRLIEPLRADIDKSKKIVLSPDASLWLIPWATLPVSEEKYLIEDHPLQLVISSRDLAQAKQTDLKLSPPVIMADPGFDLNSKQIESATKAVLRTNYEQVPPSELRSAILTSDLPKVARLPNTAIEAQAIIPDLEHITQNKPQVYMGEFALEGVFKKVKQPKMMVISTHGIFLPSKLKGNKVPGESLVSISNKSDSSFEGATENPLLRCGLMLAGCNQRPVSETDDDGILTGDEIMASNLRGTEMVVLSACETGVGEVRNGDGVAGLRQAFQLAGARSVVATLWMIDDRESALFMRDFFKHLGEGQLPDDAMRSAQLERIEARRNRFGAAHPFYWAAWTITGRME